MKRYKVTTTYFRAETYTTYTTAFNENDAESIAEEQIEEGLEGEQETLESKVETEQLDVTAPHEIVHGSSDDPDRFNEQICLVCDRKLVWTGQSADDPRNTTGATIPGPWVHEAEVVA